MVSGVEGLMYRCIHDGPTLCSAIRVPKGGIHMLGTHMSVRMCVCMHVRMYMHMCGPHFPSVV